MRFEIGCDLEEFRQYYARCGIEEDVALETEGLGEAEEFHIRRDPSHLIVFREDGNIIGHAIWHESNTRENVPGNRGWRGEKDRKILEKLLAGEKSFVELHELWLTKKNRGKSYGSQFLDFFEDYIRKRGHQDIIYYAFDTAAIAICRGRGYKEAFGVESGGHPCYVLHLSLELGRA